MNAIVKKLGDVMLVQFHGSSTELVEFAKGMGWKVPDEEAKKGDPKKKETERKAPTRKKAPVKKAGKR